MDAKAKHGRDYQEHIDALREVQSVAALRDAFAASLKNLGVSWFTYGGLRLPRADRTDPVIITTYPDEWSRHYNENRYYETDAVVRSGFQNFLPVRVGRSITVAGRYRPTQEVLAALCLRGQLPASVLTNAARIERAA